MTESQPTAREQIGDPDGKRALNEALFTTIAGRYDLINRILSFGRDAVWKDRLVAELPDIAGPRCLDLACGTGDITFRLARRYPAGEVLGLDLTEAMVEAARKQNTAENVVFVQGDMGKLDFPDGHFDIVTGGYALRNAPVLETTLAEIHRVCRPGATAVFLDFSKPANRFVQTLEFAALKLWAGFWGLAFYRKAGLYTYIAESLRQFPDTHRFREVLAEHGFAEIRSRKHFVILAETVICRKA